MKRFDRTFIKELLTTTDLATLVGSYIQLRKIGSTFNAHCPFHDDRTPSFVIWESSPYYHCFGCGARGNALSFLTKYAGLGFVDAVRELCKRTGKEPVLETTLHGEVLKREQFAAQASKPKPAKTLELYDPPLPAGVHNTVPSCHPSLGLPLKVWWYTPSYAVYLFPNRYNREGKKVKEFRPLHWDLASKQWLFKSPPDKLLPLYRLHELKDGQKILFCEGEKAADAAREYFGAAFCTTTAHGSNSASRSCFKSVDGHNVLIWPDNDLAGCLYACELAELCQQAGATEVKIVYWECTKVPSKWDLADALKEGWCKSQVVNSACVFRYSYNEELFK